MPRSTFDILCAFESQPPNDFLPAKDFFLALPEEEQLITTATVLIRADLQFARWNSTRLKESLELLASLQVDPKVIHDLLLAIYQDRAELNDSVHIDDFKGSILEEQVIRSPNEPLGLGEYVGDYRVIARICRGKFGVVYQGLDPVGQKVAIKSIVCNLEASTEQLHRQLLEKEFDAAKLLDGLSFPKPIAWLENCEGYPCFVMEFIDGQRLSEVPKDQPLSPQDAAKIVGNIALDLFLAHARDFIHRDVKSANVILQPNGRPVLLDFGFAIREEETHSREGEVAGTLGHASPDTILGNVPEMDGRNDIFSLGPMLYYLQKGMPLFPVSEREDALAQATLTNILKKDIRGVPSELAEVIGKCVESNPICRYNSGLEVAVSLYRFCNPECQLKAPCPAPLIAYRIGKEIAEIQCNLDAFKDYFDCPDALPEWASGALFMASEEVNRVKLLFGNHPFNRVELPVFDHHPFSLLIYQKHEPNILRNKQRTLSQLIPPWLNEALSAVQATLADQPQETLALFELGLSATLAKSVAKYAVDIERVARHSGLPVGVWEDYAKFLKNRSVNDFVIDRWRRFHKSVERALLYSPEAMAIADEVVSLFNQAYSTT